MPPKTDDVLQDRVLEDLAEAHNYRRWLVDLCRPYVGRDLLEIGSGSGSYTEEWAALPGMRVTASEADPERVARLRSRFEPHAKVTVRQLALPCDETAAYDSVVALNVLEHIEDDRAAMASMSRLIRPGGSVVVIVPAFAFGMSRFDRSVGHHRRYRLKRLRAVATDSGLVVERLTYVNSIGLLAWIIGMRLLRMAPRAGRVLRTWDSAVIPLIRRAERRWQPPFGQSALLVASRPTGTSSAHRPFG